MNMTIQDKAVKIVEEEFGTDIVRQLGLTTTLKVLRTIERAIDETKHPVKTMKMDLKFH